MSDESRTPPARAFVQASRSGSIENGGKEVGESKAEHFADADTTEEFVYFFSGELLELVGASNIHGTAREEVREAILTILTEGLMPAFEHLKKIRASDGQQLSTLECAQLYDDFSRELWHAYKDLMPQAALLLGFDIGFIFQKESAFKRGVAEFYIKHPSLIAPKLGEFLLRQRKAWQSDFARFRNHYLEPRPEDQTKFAAFYETQNAEMLFSLVWGVMANVLPVFIEANFTGGSSIEEIPLAERDPQKRKRFRYVVRDTVRP